MSTSPILGQIITSLISGAPLEPTPGPELVPMQEGAWAAWATRTEPAPAEVEASQAAAPQAPRLVVNADPGR